MQAVNGKCSMRISLAAQISCGRVLRFDSMPVMRVEEREDSPRPHKPPAIPSQPARWETQNSMLTASQRQTCLLFLCTSRGFIEHFLAMLMWSTDGEKSDYARHPNCDTSHTRSSPYPALFSHERASLDDTKQLIGLSDFWLLAFCTLEMSTYGTTHPCLCRINNQRPRSNTDTGHLSGYLTYFTLPALVHVP